MPVVDPDPAGFVTYLGGAAILIVALIIFAHMMWSDMRESRDEIIRLRSLTGRSRGHATSG